MLLKVKSEDGWIVIPGIDQVEYGDAKSQKVGFYTNNMKEKNPLNVVVIRVNSTDEYFYVPYDNATLVRSIEKYEYPTEVQVNGRSALEAEFFELQLDEVHTELVTFMSWLHDYVKNTVYVFNEAYLLNDNGKTIEKIS